MSDFANDVERSLAVLQQGGVILYPTDTLWSLGCDATNAAAVQKLLNLKQNPASNGLIVLLAAERDVLQYVAAPDMEVFDFLKTQAKPTTVIYEHGLEVSDAVLGPDGSLAIRLVQEDFCRHLLKRLKRPLVATSANVHGQPSPQCFDDVSTALIQQTDYVVAWRQKEPMANASSSIVKWRNGRVV